MNVIPTDIKLLEPNNPSYRAWGRSFKLRNRTPKKIRNHVEYEFQGYLVKWESALRNLLSLLVNEETWIQLSSATH